LRRDRRCKTLQIEAGENKVVRTAALFYSTVVLVLLAIGLYGFLSLFWLAAGMFERSRFIG